jgi:hypothetical protein
MRRNAVMEKFFSFFLLITLFFFINGTNVHADLVSDGRVLLFNYGNPTYSGILAANQKFKDALSINPNNQEAHLFYAVTSLGAFALQNGGGGGLKTLRDVFEAFGMVRNSNDFIQYSPGDALYDTEYNSPYDAPAQFPANAPSGEALRQFLAGPVMILLNNSIINLDKINSTFQTILTTDETGDEAVEVDYGDVLMFKAILNAGKCLISIISSYNINIDTDEIFNKVKNDQFGISPDLLNVYPNFLILLSGGVNTLQSAEAKLLDTINNYLNASNFIRAETDDQFNDLIAFDPDDLQDEELFRQNLIILRVSLNDNTTADLTDGVELISLNLNLLFGHGSGPFDLRDFLPRFDRNNDPIAGTVGSGLGNDATLGGILPGFSQSDWGVPSIAMPWIPLLLFNN